MSAIDHLIEQHILESESHMRHIDELLAKARAARMQSNVAPHHLAQLNRLEKDHDRLAGELNTLRQSPAPDAVDRSKGLKAVLQTIGLELEKTLTAIGDKGGH